MGFLNERDDKDYYYPSYQALISDCKAQLVNALTFEPITTALPDFFTVSHAAPLLSV